MTNSSQNPKDSKSHPTPNRWILGILGVILVASLATGAYYTIEAVRNNPSQATTQTTQTDQTKTNAKTGDSAIYPDPSLTPGDVIAGVTKDQVCTPGYSSGVRDVPQSEKKQVYSEYKVTTPVPTGSYEVDHFISLELGGSNDVKNLWPEPADPKPGFHEKDKVENYLHKEVCDGHMALVEAQDQIKTDWYAVYLKIK